MPAAPEKILELKSQAKLTRRKIVEIIYRAKSSHVGSALSAADIITSLYFGGVMRVDPHHPKKEGRDKLVLSKGHAVSAVYATLGFFGFFPIEKLEEYGRDGTKLASHVVLDVLPGLETSNGSGGHGLPLGAGMALAAKQKGEDSRIFVLSGDGEMEEGSVWEALLFAGHHQLSNLTLIIDRNYLQDGMSGLRTNQILDIDPLDEKLRAFRWEVESVNGHDFDELISALENKSDKPRAIIANTLKGKGVSFMENRGEWHGKCPDAEQYEVAIKELS